MVNRATAAYELGDFAVAMADLDAALEADAGNPDLLLNRGLVHEAAGRPDYAAADYTLALQNGQADRAQLLYQRGRCHAAMSLLADAEHDLSEHLALGSSPYEQEIDDLLEACRRGGQPAEYCIPDLTPS
jgi:tetratricopeptide (TPR) repeat protein